METPQLLEQSVAVCSHLHRKKKFPNVQKEKPRMRHRSLGLPLNLPLPLSLPLNLNFTFVGLDKYIHGPSMSRFVLIGENLSRTEA